MATKTIFGMRVPGVIEKSGGADGQSFADPTFITPTELGMGTEVSTGDGTAYQLFITSQQNHLARAWFVYGFNRLDISANLNVPSGFPITPIPTIFIDTGPSGPTQLPAITGSINLTSENSPPDPISSWYKFVDIIGNAVQRATFFTSPYFIGANPIGNAGGYIEAVDNDWRFPLTNFPSLDNIGTFDTDLVVSVFPSVGSHSTGTAIVKCRVDGAMYGNGAGVIKHPTNGYPAVFALRLRFTFTVGLSAGQRFEWTNGFDAICDEDANLPGDCGSFDIACVQSGDPSGPDMTSPVNVGSLNVTSDYTAGTISMYQSGGVAYINTASFTLWKEMLRPDP